MKLEFDHIALSVPDIAAAVTFYRDEFPQVRVLHEDPTWALIQLDTVKIAFVLDEHHPPHMAFRVDSREELERLSKLYNQPIKVHRDRSESFYQNDPGGNAIEIIYYPPKD